MSQELTKAGWPVLTEFPTSGVCWSLDPNLLRYLKKICPKCTKPIEPIHLGIAWNNTGYWGVTNYSIQTPYSISHLLPFIRANAETPLTPEESIPEKWCLDITSKNEALVNEFLILKKDEYLGYEDDWKAEEGCRIYYPQKTPGCFAVFKGNGIAPGYKQISTKQFITHVLTNNNLKTEENGKQEGGSSIKVQRPDLSIRDSSPIRASGIKCPKSKIQIRDGYSTN